MYRALNNCEATVSWELHRLSPTSMDARKQRKLTGKCVGSLPSKILTFLYGNTMNKKHQQCKVGIFWVQCRTAMGEKTPLALHFLVSKAACQITDEGKERTIPYIRSPASFEVKSTLWNYYTSHLLEHIKNSHIGFPPKHLSVVWFALANQMQASTSFTFVVSWRHFLTFCWGFHLSLWLPEILEIPLFVVI